jgi:hypothetical protein
MEINESDYNNNTYKLYLSTMSQMTDRRIHLMKKYAIRVEDTVCIAIMNISRYPAIAPVLEGYNRKKEKVCEKIIPVIKAYGTEQVFINDAEKEICYLKLIYQSEGMIKKKLIYPVYGMREWLLIRCTFHSRGEISMSFMNIGRYPAVSPVLEGYNKWGKKIYEKGMPDIDAGAVEKLVIPNTKGEIYYLKLIYYWKDIIKERKIYPSYMKKHGIFNNTHGREKKGGRF